MLVEFRVANFRSFKEEQTLSLVAANADDKHRGNLIEQPKFNLLKAAAVYGANASGKNNLIRAIGYMSLFVRDSATKINQGDKIPGMAPFRLAPASRQEPSRFEVVVIVDGTRYEYGFAATRERVHDEWLTAYPPGKNKRRQRWFERSWRSDDDRTDWKFRSPLTSRAGLLKETTRANGLILSRGAELNVKPLTPLFMWFRLHLWLFDLSSTPAELVQYSAKRIKEDQGFHDRVLRLIRHADLGIDGFAVAEQTLPEEIDDDGSGLELAEAARKAHNALREASRPVAAAYGIDPTRLTVKALHCPMGTKSYVAFDLVKDESNGTQRFFALAGPVLDALDTGSVIVADELECSMHPLLTRKLIELFQSPRENKKGAQLIFATHDSTLMDPELFRRDQLWLVEKARSGASELFSLHDFDTEDRPRSTEAFQRRYLAGRYGGVPNFGPTFENLGSE